MLKVEFQYTPEYFKIISDDMDNIFSLKFKIYYLVMTVAVTGIAIAEKSGFFMFLSGVAWLVAAFIAFLKILINPQRQYKKYIKKSPDNTITYIFNDSEIISSETANNIKNNFRYDDVKSFDEKENFFIIRYNSGYIMIFRKEDIKQGSAEELKRLFKKMY